MAFSRLNPGGWTDDIDTVTAFQLNGIDVNQSRAMDGTAGGTYGPTAPIIINGTNGMIWAGTGNGAFPRLNALTTVRRHQLHVASLSAAGDVVEQRAAGGVGSLTGTVSGNTIAVPHTLTVSPPGAGKWHVLEIERPIDGATLVDVALMMGYLAVAPPGVYAALVNTRFDVIRWSVGGGGVTMDSLRSTGDVADDFTIGQAEAGNRRLQTITCDQNNVIDTDNFRYGLYVEHPTDGAAFQVRIFGYDLRSTYTVNLLQPA